MEKKIKFINKSFYENFVKDNEEVIIFHYFNVYSNEAVIWFNWFLMA
jgi:hypothetical protein